MKSICPICARHMPPRDKNTFFPFCSEKCQLVDLGRWLNEDYRIPGPPAEPEADGYGHGRDSEEDAL